MHSSWQGECDVAVIGGGASGLAAAIASARAGARVAVVERDVACGLSILATGNGRCNLSNADLDAARYVHPAAARTVMGASPEMDIAAFFDSLGLMTCAVDGRLYPVTRRAESVRDVLLRGCSCAGVQLLCGYEVKETVRTERGWRLVADAPARSVRFDGDVRRARKALAAAPRREVEVFCKSVVLAVGGSSSSVCRLFGLPHVDETPVLCPIACELESAAERSGATALARLDGLRVEAGLSLLRDDACVHHEQGEVLFRRYGISGIAAFDLSRRIASGDVIELDLFPELDEHALAELLVRRESAVGRYVDAGPDWFDGLLARPLAAFVYAEAQSIEVAARLVKHLRLYVAGCAEERQAQVHRGGIPLDALDLETLAVAPGLFACGEALDQDADCGGFNLAWAWLSGLRAGKAAASRL